MSIEELKGIVVLKAISRLLEWNKKGKVSWSHIVGNGGAKGSKLKDFKEISEVLSDDNSQCNFTISLFHDGTAIVGWNIYNVNKEDNQESRDT